MRTLYKNDKPTTYTLMKRASVFLAGASLFLASTVFEHNKTLQNVIQAGWVDQAFIIIPTVFGVGLLTGLHFYAKRYVLQLDVLDQKTVRLVTGRLAPGYRELFIPVEHIETSSRIEETIMQPQQQEGRRRDYFFVHEAGSNLNYILDISSEHIYVDKEQVKGLFYVNRASVVARKSNVFPYKKQ